jgi:hypothetical protein
MLEPNRMNPVKGSLMPVWCNGSHDGLKLRCPYGRVGSSPTTGTHSCSVFFIWQTHGIRRGCVCHDEDSMV